MISRKKVTGAKRINNKSANTFESLIKSFSKILLFLLFMIVLYSSYFRSFRRQSE